MFFSLQTTASILGRNTRVGWAYYGRKRNVASVCMPDDMTENFYASYVGCLTLLPKQMTTDEGFFLKKRHKFEDAFNSVK